MKNTGKEITVNKHDHYLIVIYQKYYINNCNMNKE